VADHYKKNQELYEELLFMLEEGFDRVYWEDVHSNVHYYEGDTCPVGPSPQKRGLQVGEFDTILVNYDDRNAFYFEVKTAPEQVAYGMEQLDRAREFFDGDLNDEDEWAVIGDLYLDYS